MKHTKKLLLAVGAVAMTGATMYWLLLKQSDEKVTITKHFTYECQPKWNEAIEKEFVKKFGFLPSREPDSLTRYQSSLLESQCLINAVKCSADVTDRLDRLVKTDWNRDMAIDEVAVRKAAAEVLFKIDESQVGRLPIECNMIVSAKSRHIAEIVTRAYVEALQAQVQRDNETICRKRFSRFFPSGNDLANRSALKDPDLKARIEFLQVLSKTNAWVKLSVEP